MRRPVLPVDDASGVGDEALGINVVLDADVVGVPAGGGQDAGGTGEAERSGDAAELLL